MRFLKVFFSDKYYILADQVLVSLLNFGAVFFLSSILKESMFSQFVLLYVYITLAYTVLTAVFSAPILVYATKKWTHTKYSYLTTNVLYLFFFSLIICLIEFFFLRKQIPDTSFGLFLFVVIGISLVDVLKRFVFSTKTAFLIYTPISSALANLIFFGGVFLFKSELTIDLILIFYGLSYLTTSILLLSSLILFPNKESLSVDYAKVFSFDYTRSIFKTHFRYSKWILLGSVSFWIYTQGIYIYGSILNISDFEIAKTRTIQNLFGVFTILMVAMENYLTPLLVEQSIGNEEEITRSTKNIYKKHFKRILLLYVLVIPMMYLVYTLKYESSYGDGMVYIVIMWFIQLIAISTKPLAIALKVKEITYPLFLSHLFAALAMLLIGFIIVKLMTNNGLLLIMLGSYLIANVVNYIYYNKIFNK